MSEGAILVIDTDEARAARLGEALEAGGVRTVVAHTTRDILAAVYADPPRCIVLPFGLPGTNSGKSTLLDEIKADNIYGHLPAILMVTPEDLARIDWQATPADDYVFLPVDPETLLSRVRLCMARAQRDVNANPLTGLPGNITIVREAERRLAENRPFSTGYLDLDNFKPFNDKYGFSRGDEVLRMTARILVNAIRGLNDPQTYVGHVGGDDFVFLAPPALAEPACKEIIHSFDLIVPNFYDDDDRHAGGIHSVDRRGNAQFFPLMTCSIAVVDTSIAVVDHIGDISSRAADVKKYAKTLPGSNFLVDRRH